MIALDNVKHVIHTNYMEDTTMTTQAAAPEAPKKIHRTLKFTRRSASIAARSLKFLEGFARDFAGTTPFADHVAEIKPLVDALAARIATIPDGWQPDRKARAAAPAKTGLTDNDKVEITHAPTKAGFAEWLAAEVDNLFVHRVAVDAKGRTRYLLRVGSVSEGARIVGFVVPKHVRKV